MALDKAEVAHIAALARIRLTEAELDPLAAELSDPDLGRAAGRNRHVGCGADDQRRGDAPADARRHGHRRRLPRRDPPQRAAIRARRTEEGLLRGAEGHRVTALTDLTLADARAALRAKQLTARE